MKRNLPLFVVFTLVFGLIACVQAVADRALVVGVNRYTSLPKENQLDGCVPDADAMAGALKSYGFRVTEVTDEGATKTRIFDAMNGIAKEIKPNEKFVFFFAGHGCKTPDGVGAILPSNAEPTALANFISKTELDRAILAVPAGARTVLLDSCFSGAMERGLRLKGGSEAKARYFNFFKSSKKDLQLVAANGSDDPEQIVGGGAGYCVFAAANASQRAYEQDFDGHPHGLFTHFLVEAFHNAGSASALFALPWSSVQSEVTGDVIKASEGAQSPVLSPRYAPIPVFHDQSALPVVHPKVQSIWQTFSEDHADKSKVFIEMTPDLATIHIGQKFHFSVTSGGDGYLVVLELDTDGNLDLLYPASRQADDGRTRGGVAVLPDETGKAYTVDSIGNEKVKAILFHSRSDAQSLLSGFSDSLTFSTADEAGQRRITLTDANTAEDRTPFYTSSTGFQAAAEEPGASN